MQTKALNQQISNFLQRKDAEFPELAIAGRHESRTVKYAETRRQPLQKLFFSRNAA